MSWHDSVSAWNHVKDMVTPLTANVCIAHHETFSIKCNSMHVSNDLGCHFQQCSWEIGSA